MRRPSRPTAVVAAAALTLLGAGVVLAPAASAEDYAPYSASANRSRAPIGTAVLVTGRTAASWAEPGPVYPGPGTVLCLYRKADNSHYRRINICTTVNKDRTFRLRAYLGVLGTHTYAMAEKADAPVGYPVLTDDMAMSTPPFTVTTTR